MFDKVLIITRAKSGSGKSLFAEYLASMHPNTTICCADDSFVTADGEYLFDSHKLGFAHLSCQKKFKEAIDKAEKLIIVANTNCSIKDCKYYDEIGRAAGYTIFYTVLENRHNGVNQHGCSQEVLDRQERNLRNSLKL